MSAVSKDPQYSNSDVPDGAPAPSSSNQTKIDLEESSPPPEQSLADLRRTLDALINEVASVHKYILLGRVSAMIVHEINNILTPVLARAEMTQESAEVDRLQSVLDRTFTGVQRAVEVARRLLQLAKGKSLGAGPCQIAPVVSEVLAIGMDRRRRARIETHVDVADDLAVMADPVLFEQVMLNLVLNAVDAVTERGGKLSIAAGRAGDRILIEISDNGAGMSPTDQARHATSVASDETDAEHWSDNGFGLGFCRLVAQHHNASMEFLDNPGGGCLVRLRWPSA